MCLETVFLWILPTLTEKYFALRKEHVVVLVLLSGSVVNINRNTICNENWIWSLKENLEIKAFYCCHGCHSHMLLKKHWYFNLCGSTNVLVSFSLTNIFVVTQTYDLTQLQKLTSLFVVCLTGSNLLTDRLWHIAQDVKC